MNEKIIRIEFWNGQLDKKGNLVKTQHNPCLWTNVEQQNKPWRKSYKQALAVITRYFNKQLTDTDFLHHLRYIAYGIGKRQFDDKQVVWWGNMTQKHKPKLCLQNEQQKYTINFTFQNGEWKADIDKTKVDFYWPL